MQWQRAPSNYNVDKLLCHPSPKLKSHVYSKLIYVGGQAKVKHYCDLCKVWAGIGQRNVPLLIIIRNNVDTKDLGTVHKVSFLYKQSA